MKIPDNTGTRWEDPAKVREFDRYVKYLNSPEAKKPRNGRAGLQYMLGHREDRQSMPDELPTTHLWVLPGLAYTVARMDKSVFQVFANSELGRGLHIPTYKSDRRLITLTAADVDHEWYNLLQGVPAVYGTKFIAFVEGLNVRNRQLNTEIRLTVGNIKFKGRSVSVLLPQSSIFSSTLMSKEGQAIVAIK